jgi:hypothetical protein
MTESRDPENIVDLEQRRREQILRDIAGLDDFWRSPKGIAICNLAGVCAELGNIIDDPKCHPDIAKKLDILLKDATEAFDIFSAEAP